MKEGFVYIGETSSDVAGPCGRRCGLVNIADRRGSVRTVAVREGDCVSRGGSVYVWDGFEWQSAPKAVPTGSRQCGIEFIG